MVGGFGFLLGIKLEIMGVGVVMVFSFGRYNVLIKFECMVDVLWDGLLIFGVVMW